MKNIQDKTGAEISACRMPFDSLMKISYKRCIQLGVRKARSNGKDYPNTYCWEEKTEDEILDEITELLSLTRYLYR